MRSEHDAEPERVTYAQTWEDPELDADALDVGPGDRVVAIGSGGCTPLSLLARAPRAVDAVDTSAGQLALIALKRAAVRTLDADAAVAFLGGTKATAEARAHGWERVAMALETGARTYWERRSGQLHAGAIWQGRADRFVAVLQAVARTFVVGGAHVEALFAARSLDDQRAIFADSWNTYRWRALFGLLHQRLLDVGFARGAYGHLDAGDWGRDLRVRAERCLTEVPAARSYFAAQMFLGRYPDGPEGRPPYLTGDGAEAVRRYGDRLALHYTDVRSYLAAQPRGSVDKLVLSNVDEWLPEAGRRALFTEVVRAVRPGGRITCRALLVARPIPSIPGLVVDEARSAALGRRERAFFNASFRVLEVQS